jgi:hypothetical protein
MVEPTLNALEACHRPALSKGQKENKIEKGQEVENDERI